MYFNVSKLLAENGLLSLEDLKPLDDQIKDGYSPTCLFSDEYREYLTVMSYSATEQKIKFSTRNSQ